MRIFRQRFWRGLLEALRNDGRGSTLATLRRWFRPTPRPYSPLVTVGSYFVVEDGLVDLFPPGYDGRRRQIGKSWDGPFAAVGDFLAVHPEFEVDESRERYLLTYNPRGYLRRKTA